MTALAHAHARTLKKTASYYVMHMAVAAAVAFLVTGDLWMALTLSLLEPTVQAVAFFFHEKAWDRHPLQQPPAQTYPSRPTPIHST
ncbi:MAG: DUF2061 domain-containing protein [Burkholderiaceae bacterium]